MTIKKMRLLNLRIADQQLDEIERIAIERFDGNTSEAIRFLAKLGISLGNVQKIGNEKMYTHVHIANEVSKIPILA